jgi:hypothetical protein
VISSAFCVIFIKAARARAINYFQLEERIESRWTQAGAAQQTGWQRRAETPSASRTRNLLGCWLADSSFCDRLDLNIHRRIILGYAMPSTPPPPPRHPGDVRFEAQIGRQRNRQAQAWPLA